ncbi:MAG: ABC transporter ATP-binding protein [Caldilineaceae bacterium]
MGAIRFDDVSKEFPGMRQRAVDHCSLEVTDGEFVVLLGPSGCGKTTLMKMVNRLYEPTSGTITLDGKDVQQMNGTDLRRRIGYVIQQIGLFPHMTVAQNISVVPRLLGWDSARIHKRVDELLALVDLQPAEYRHRYPAQLSGGQQQRVGVARALAGDPTLILMDEPFGAVDAITRGSLQEEMLRLQRQLHKTVLFVTHDVDEALRLADRIVIMQAGKVIQYASPLEILGNPANQFVKQLMGGDDILRQLSLVRIEAAMQRVHPSSQNHGQVTIDQGCSLRDALSLLLRGDTNRLVVTEDGKQTGQLTLEDIRTHAESTGKN